MRVADRSREELLQLLLRDGVLRRSETQPIIDLDGQSARWMLDSLGVSLTRAGARLAARRLLKLLDRFEGRQLATFGTIGIPLLQAVVLESGGRYRGLLVRKELKTYGSRRRIEGPIDPREPVVMIDDSISSGWSMEHCARFLREAGLEVEGGVALVRFGYGGIARLAEQGVRCATVYDVDQDFAPRMAGETVDPENPTLLLPELRWSRRRLPEGLHPCEVARRVIDHHLATGETLLPPKRLDRPYDSAGGAFVSLRRRDDVHDRPARMGFWYFPTETSHGAPGDLVRAAVQTSAELREKSKKPRAVLARCAVAVTFFGPLEECRLGELDDLRYGIVVRSAERAPVMGGALPRMPGIRNPYEQFHHAAYNNARLFPLEPYRLFRHTLTKWVEPGFEWQPSGVPLDGAVAESREVVAGPLARRARDEVLAFLGLAPRPSAPLPPLPEGLDQLFVTVYARGRLQGCVGAAVRPGSPTLRDLARAAVHDARFPALKRPRADEVAVGLSLLRGGLHIGEADPEWMAKVTRHGEQAVEVGQDGASGLLLPAVVVLDDLSPLAFAEAALEKAGLRAPPYDWHRYDCTSWLATPEAVVAQKPYFPARDEAAVPSGEALERHLLGLLSGFLARTHSARGEPYTRYLPIRDVLKTEWVAPWLAHRAWTKARLGLRREALEDLRRFRPAKGKGGGHWLRLPGSECSVSELAFAVLARCALRQPRAATALCDTLWSRVGPTGRIEAMEDGPGELQQDYFGPQALLALGVAVKAKATGDRELATRALSHYRRRFRGNRAWGAYAWLAQAAAAWGLARRDAEWVDFCFEVVDGGLESQSLQRGCFYTPDEVHPPSALTGVYLEGVAAAHWAARLTGDARRAGRYARHLEAGFHFLESLVYQPRDRMLLPNFAWAEGGLRTAPDKSEVRLDYVQHALGALLSKRDGLWKARR